MSVFASVLGQERVIAQLQSAAEAPVHAYLFTGPPGTGKREAARAFAALLLHPDGDEDGRQRVLAERHPDFVIVERKGAAIAVEQAREIVRLAMRTPIEGSRKVLLLTDFHLVDKAAPVLLKTIEEPPTSTVFIILAEHVPAELITIASRCVSIEFSPLDDALIAKSLIASGIDEETAEGIAVAAGGRLDRARLLAADPAFVARRDIWLSIPIRLDGSGSAIATITDELMEAIASAVEPLAERQAEELNEYIERIKQTGERAGLKKELEDRHKREQRRIRMDELRFGLVTLSQAYRDRLLANAGREASRQMLATLGVIRDANESLVRNPNETLFLQGLLARISSCS